MPHTIPDQPVEQATDQVEKFCLLKLKNKLNRKYPEDGPTAKKDDHGNLVTGKKEIPEQNMKHYKTVQEIGQFSLNLRNKNTK